MFKLYLLSLISFFVIYSCASSDSNKQEKADASYPNLVSLQTPDSTASQPGKVYIDSVKKVSHDKKKGILISGNFADGCTHLKSVTHNIEGDSLKISLSTWRDPEAMCTQALVPFSYIYDKLSEEEMASHSKVHIQSKTYPL